MAANGGGPPPFIKKEEELFDSIQNSIAADNCRRYNVERNSDDYNGHRGVSIAERRAAKCGFNASHVSIRAAVSPPPCFTVPPGLSPSALLDSPIMLPNAEAQMSPTTGTYYPSPNHENLKLKLKITNDSMETCSSENNLMGDNNYKARTQEFEYPKELCFDNRNEMMILENHDKTPPSLPHANHQNHHKNSATTASIPKLEMSKNSEDGYYWRKYGQKHVKGSEYPRSYYKCTNTNCPVTKKVERSHDGHIAEIVYKGSHNHPQPKQMMMATTDQAAAVLSSADHLAAGDDDDVDHAMDGTTANSSPYLNDFPDPPAFSGEEAGDGCSEGASLPEDSADAESEAAKKRKRDGEVVPRSTSREPKVVVQLESEVDILDDGYRWRKYGQKVVKGNPNPRSYYKCTTPNCPVRKHVERAADDIKSVITTYEGKHTHLVPSGTKGANGNINSSEAPCPTASTKAAGKQQVQDLPLYLDRKPMQFNYSTTPGSGGGGDLNFGVSSPYPLPFPPFHSMPNYVMKTYSKHYSDYMPMPMSMPMQMPMQMPMSMPMPTSSPSSSSSHLPSFHYGGDTQPSTQVKPKEEQDEVYDNCLNIPNPPNGTM